MKMHTGNGHFRTRSSLQLQGGGRKGGGARAARTFKSDALSGMSKRLCQRMEKYEDENRVRFKKVKIYRFFFF
uniref:Uncharacterized protein n=1 Tax=Anguilla anguilla TaxID=7936 RepID=A0A0E9WSC4_ANGAN